jgi:citrate lyase beta subunit
MALDGPFRSILFVPGNRPDRFDRALESSASLICIDLEDALNPSEKAPARQEAIAYLTNRVSPRIAVRINGMATREGLADLLAMTAAPRPPAILLIPKVQSSAELGQIDSVLGECPSKLIPIVESCEGLAHAHAIAGAPRTTAVLFGGGDLAAELGVTMAWEPLFAARAQVVQACARARIPAIDVPFLAIGDDAGLHEETARIKVLGFAGKIAIHPNQVATINACFMPTAREIAEAREAMAIFTAADRSAVLFKGKLLDAPLVRHYEIILADIAKL